MIKEPMNGEYPASIVMEDRDCPLGCSRDDETVLWGFDQLYRLPGKFQVVKCRHCGLMRTNPRPTIDTIGFYYPSDYSPYLRTRVSQRNSLSHKVLIGAKRIARELTPTYGNAVPKLNPGHLLEIGCASGVFLHRMAQKGWKVEGIEPNAQAAVAASGLGYKVYNGFIETAPEPDNPYDLIAAWMVLEHVHEPILTLEKLARWTKPNGWLAFSVPDAGSKESVGFGHNWYALELPRHLHHFTIDTLRMALNESGWELKHTLYQRTMGNLIGSIGYKIRQKREHSQLASLLVDKSSAWQVNLAFYPVSILASALKQTGRLTVWAKKRA